MVQANSGRRWLLREVLGQQGPMFGWVVDTLLRNQEKRALAKGVFAESSVKPMKKDRNTQGFGPSSTSDTQTATDKKGVHFTKTPF